MNKKKTGFLILTIGIVAGLAAIAMMAIGVFSAIDAMKSVVVVPSGGSKTVHLEEAGTYVLWADIPGTYPGPSGSPVSPDPMTYSLIEVGTGTAAPFIVNSMSMTRTYGSTASSGIGQFEISAPGQYEFSAFDPGLNVPQFSLTQGSFGGDLAKTGLSIGGSILVGFIGLAAIITGIILVVTSKKSITPPPPPALP